MTLVNVFHLPVTPFKNRNAAEHGTLFTVDHVKTAPNIIIPWMKRSRARAVIRTYFHPTNERTHDFTPYSALNSAFSAYASRSDVITSRRTTDHVVRVAPEPRERATSEYDLCVRGTRGRAFATDSRAVPPSRLSLSPLTNAQRHQRHRRSCRPVSNVVQRGSAMQR